MQITLPVQISYKGKTVNARALHDTGAETFAFIDQSIASQLGLPQGEAIGYTGIAGSSVGFKSVVDKLSITTAPNCALGSSAAPVDVMVGQVTIPNVQLLVGEYFMKSVQLNTDVDASGNVLISCKAGPKVAITEPIPKEYIILGGAAVLLVLAWLFFRD